MKETTHQTTAWVYATAFLFSLNGGLINAVSLLSILAHPVGYVTGNLTYIGLGIGAGAYPTALGILGLVLSFLMGAMISGLVIHASHYQQDSRYDIVLALQCVVMSAATLLLAHGCYSSGYLLAMTMGLQNAMTSHYGSALIRTTHMTGTLTDLGLALSHRLKGIPIPLWKILLYTTLITGFTLGATLSSLIYARWGAWSLSLSVGLYAAFCIVNFVRRHRRQRAS